MYGFWTAIAFLGRMPFSSRSCREKSTFSPVFVERLSIRIRSRGTPRPTATSAKISASGRLHIWLVRAPRWPEKTTSGAQPPRNTSAPRSATRVSWLPRTMMQSAFSSAWWTWW